MANRLSYILAASEILLNGDSAPKKELLLSAAEKFWAGLYERENLPDDLRLEADAIVARLMARGPLEMSIPAMSEAEATEAAEAIVAFASRLEKQGLFPEPG